MVKRLLLLCALLLPLTVMGQSYSTSKPCGTSESSCALASVSVSAGNYATVFIIGYSGSGTITATDGNSDSFTDCGTQAGTGATLITNTYIANALCGKFGTTNASEVITCHDSAGMGLSCVASYGAGLSNATVDKALVSAALGNVTSVSAPATGTLVSSSEIVFGGLTATSGGARSISTSTPWTLGANSANGPSVGDVYQVVSATTSVTPSATWNASPTNGNGFTVSWYSALPPAATPTFSPNGVPLGFTSPATTVTITSSTSGATDVYTTDGSTPATSPGTCTPTGTGTALTQSGTSGVTVNLSSAVTLQAIACLSGDSNSSVANSVFNLFPDQPIIGQGSTVPEPFSEYFDADYYVDLIDTVPTQKPLIPLGCAQQGGSCNTISSTQVAAWTGMGYGATNNPYLYPAFDQITGNSYGVRGTGSFGYSVYTGVTIPANQYASMYYHAYTTSGLNGVAVGTNCAPGSSFSGNVLVLGTGGSQAKWYTNGSLNTTFTNTFSEGDLYEVRQYGTVAQPCKYVVGVCSQISGLAATYTVTAATNPPCIGALGTTNNATGVSYGGADGYNVSIGAVATSNPGVSPIAYTPTYSTVSTGSVTSGTTLNALNWVPTSGAFPTASLIVGNSANALSTSYALGGSDGNLAVQAHPLAAFTNTQYAHWVNDMDATAWLYNNGFGQDQSQPFVAPSYYPSTSSGCNDTTAIYCGTEPLMQGLGAGCGGSSLEYACTHRFHCTYANNASSSIAVATATLSGTSVNAITVSSSNIPVGDTTCNAIFFTAATNPGSGATATCSISGGNVSLTLTNGGSGYTSAPAIYAIPTSGASSGCNAFANYNVKTALGFHPVLMHGDEGLMIYNASTGMLSVYAKGGSAIPGWSASTTVTPMVASLTSGTTGTTIQAAGLYQVAGPTGFQGTFPYPLNGYLFDGTNWQKTTTPGTSASTAPSWNATLLGTTTSGTAVFTNEGPHPSLGTCTDPCTATSDSGYVWGGTVSTCETEIYPAGSQALTVDNTVIWRCVGEALTNDTAFQFLGSAIVPGFTNGQPGMWSKGNFGASNYPFEFGSFDAGSGNPCGSTYTCVGGTQNSYIGWWGQLRVPDEQFRILPEYVLAAVQKAVDEGWQR